MAPKPQIRIVAMAAKRQPARNAPAASGGCVTVAATSTSSGVAHAGAGSAAENSRW